VSRDASLLTLILTVTVCTVAERPGTTTRAADRAGLATPAVLPNSSDPCEVGEGTRAAFRSSLAPIDRGIGYVAFVDSMIGRMSDTMTIHAAPGRAAPVVGRYILRAVPDYSWCYRLEVYADGITDNSLEIGYETVGLPFDSLAPSAEFARVVFGFRRDSSAERGWVRLSAERTRWVLWPDHFRSLGGFLWNADELEPEFADGPDGSPVDLDLARSNGGYDFEAEIIGVDGPWLHARIRTPTPCVAPDSAIREATAWLRYLTPAGRPAVWYATRGC